MKIKFYIFTFCAILNLDLIFTQTEIEINWPLDTTTFSLHNSQKQAK